jgi:hypothetical protein
MKTVLNRSLVALTVTMPVTLLSARVLFGRGTGKKSIMLAQSEQVDSRSIELVWYLVQLTGVFSRSVHKLLL